MTCQEARACACSPLDPECCWKNSLKTQPGNIDNEERTRAVNIDEQETETR